MGKNSSRTRSYRPGKVAIRFKVGARPQECQDTIFDASDIAIARTTRCLSFYVVTVPEGSENDFIMCLRDSPHVESAERMKS